MKKYKLNEYIKRGLKYSHIKILALTLVLSLASCEEFLDVAPKGNIDATAFFSNPEIGRAHV